MTDREIARRRKGADSGCVGKEGFDSPALAVRVRGRRKSGDMGRVVYRCTVCGKFHIGGVVK